MFFLHSFSQNEAFYQALGTQLRLRTSHNLLYVIKETHFFPSLNSSLMTPVLTPLPLLSCVIREVQVPPPATKRVDIVWGMLCYGRGLTRFAGNDPTRYAPS